MADDEVHTTSGWIKLANTIIACFTLVIINCLNNFLVMICMGQEAETAALINAITLAVEVCFWSTRIVKLNEDFFQNSSMKLMLYGSATTTYKLELTKL
jgi:hypothetical protein